MQLYNGQLFFLLHLYSIILPVLNGTRCKEQGKRAASNKQQATSRQVTKDKGAKR
jgi:hypothetical protein